MLSPEIKSTDMFLATLVTLSQAQRKILSSSYLLEAKHMFESAALSKKIAIGAFATMFVSGIVTGMQQKPVTEERGPKKDHAEASWAATICLMSFLATGFFAYQYISLDLEANRLTDLSEFVVEWVQG